MYSVAKPGAVQKLVEAAPRPGPVAGLLLELAAARRGPGSSIAPVSGSTSSVPAGTSSRARPAGSRNWRTSRTLSASSIARIATAPGWPTTSRFARVPSAPLDRVDPEREVVAAAEDLGLDDDLGRGRRPRRRRAARKRRRPGPRGTRPDRSSGSVASSRSGRAPLRRRRWPGRRRAMRPTPRRTGGACPAAGRASGRRPA